MAVTTSYSFGFVETIDPSFITGNADAASLANGGVAVVGDHTGHTDATFFEDDGDITGSATSISGTEAAVSQLSNGNIVIATDNGNEAAFRIVNGAGGVVVATTPSDVAFSQLLDVDVAGGVGGGRFVVASQAFFSGTDNDIRINIRNNDGSAVTSFSIDSSVANDQNPSVVALNDGGFAVAWHRNVGSNNEMWYAVYNADGTVRRAPTLLDNIGTVNRNASVVALQNGGFAIAYEDNGWTAGDIDITLARFTSTGAFVDWDDITQTASNDTAPSATVLSNGMISVGYTNDVFGDTDTRMTLVDQNTGNALGTSTVGGSVGNEFGISIAAMGTGKVGTFHTLAGDVVGSVRQATRFTTGDGANDIITGDDLRDVIDGGAGNDSINGGGGADSMAGGLGNDLIQVDNAADQVFESVGAGIDRVVASVSYTLAAGQEIETLDVTVSGATTPINLFGNEFAQTLLGNAGVNTLSGGGGADTMRGFAGNDTYFVDNAGDLVFESSAAGQGNDRVVASVSYELAAGQEIETLDTIVGGATTPINLTGNEFSQNLLGNAGANVLNGRGGNDTMRGFGGNDTYFVDGGGDLIFEAVGGGTNDRIIVAGSSSYTLAAGVEIERMETLTTPSTTSVNFTGNAFAQVMLGNNGNNVLNGKGGADTLRGNGGNDAFLFDTALGGANIDTILDFSVPNDTIRLENLVFTGIGGNGTLNSNFFRANLSGDAQDLDDRILYEIDTGRLFFDADGSNGGAAIHFATISANLAMTSNDFLVV